MRWSHGADAAIVRKAAGFAKANSTEFQLYRLLKKRVHECFLKRSGASRPVIRVWMPTLPDGGMPTLPDGSRRSATFSTGCWDRTQNSFALLLCQVLELGLCATGFANAGRQYTTLMYTGTASGTPKLSTESAIGPLSHARG